MPFAGPRSRILAVAAAASVLVLSPWHSGAEAAPVTYFATLSGAQVVPPVPTAASGFVQVTVDSVTNKVQYSILLFGVTAGDIESAELHEGAFGTNGPVVQKLAGAGLTQITGSLGMSSAQLAILDAGGYYVEVRAVSQGGPLIRGQIMPPGAAGAQAVPIATLIPSPVPTVATAFVQPQAPAAVTRSAITPPSTGDGGLYRR